MPAEPCRLSLKFWGVRGSTPTPEAGNLWYGGNTSCFEIQSGSGERIIVDAGSGIRRLGLHLAEQNSALNLHLFLTHFHWDHIQGIPFFVPLLQAGNKITFHSFPSAQEIQTRLQRQMSDPYFTLSFNQMAATREFSQLDETFRYADFSVTPFPLHHPQGACGYRIESRGAVIVIATDLEHGDPVLDRVLREHSENADVLVYDAQYTPAEYASRQGWGHSTYAAAVKVARDAKVERLMLFHHDPTHDDAGITEIVEQAVLEFENTTAARELDIITL